MCSHKHAFPSRALAEKAAKHTRKGHHNAKGDPVVAFLCPVKIDGKRHWHVGGQPKELAKLGKR